MSCSARISKLKINPAKSLPTLKILDNRAKISFAQKNPTLIYQPVIFHLIGENYSPDFYDPIKNIFYEIIGTRQRFSQLFPKLEKFKEIFPNISLIVCDGNGISYNSKIVPDLIKSLANGHLDISNEN